MTFESEKTGQYLRAKALEEGIDERMRAVQALNYGLCTGSHASLAKMLLATLGGQNNDSTVAEKVEEAVDSNHTEQALIKQIAQSMQQSANDANYHQKEVSSLR